MCVKVHLCIWCGTYVFLSVSACWCMYGCVRVWEMPVCISDVFSSRIVHQKF